MDHLSAFHRVGQEDLPRLFKGLLASGLPELAILPTTGTPWRVEGIIRSRHRSHKRRQLMTSCPGMHLVGLTMP